MLLFVVIVIVVKTREGVRDGSGEGQTTLHRGSRRGGGSYSTHVLYYPHSPP